MTTDPDHLAAVRTVRMMMVAAVLVGVGGVAALLARTTEPSTDAGDDNAAISSAVPAAIGPAPGSPVAAYLSAQQRFLADATGTRVAVVSLVSYRSATAVDEILSRAAADGDLDVVARLVALPGGSPVAVTGPLDEWLAAQRQPLQEERDQIAEILPTIENPADPFIPTYTEDLARLDAQLAALDAAGELVFGIVVRGDAEVLRQLGSRPDVRVVAAAADGEVADAAAYRGVRPEEVDVVGTPPVRPTPP